MRRAGGMRWPWLALATVSATYVLFGVVVLLAGPAPLLGDSLYILAGLGPLAVGVLLVIHRPRNRVGRLLVVIGSAWTLGEGARIHLWTGLHMESMPGMDFAAWLLSWTFAPAWMLIPFVLAVYPSGRVVTRWLRWPIRIGLAALIVVVALAMVAPADLGGYGSYLEGMTKAWAIPALPEESAADGVFEAVSTVVVLSLAVMVTVDLVTRWRRSVGAERLQMRWFGFGMVAVIILLTAGGVVARLTGPEVTLAERVGLVLAINAIPAAIGVAVGRYHLYDIDRLISRTFTYAVVAGTLVGVFAGTVLVLFDLLPLEDDLAVAASTLVVAALFNPLRRRVQGRVDRRFNRMRYDTEQEIERFASRLRTELDLGDLTGEVLAVVTTTMQPARAGVWIRKLP